jgi:tetratricopeptide (TPR) repeat protein
MKALLLLPALFFTVSVHAQRTQRNDSLLLAKYIEKANESSLFSQNRQLYLDSVLTIVPKEAYIWQQKAMPLFKQRKYEKGMQYLDSAVKYDNTNHWLEYRAFIKCIFQKDYQAAIRDFEAVQKQNEYGFVMDHTYDLYLGLCHLQTNNFKSAAKHIEKSVNYRTKQSGVAHHLEYFYLGIVKMELDDYPNAVAAFDKALAIYSNFSDAKYYKAEILYSLNRRREALELYKEALEDSKQGYTINEDNAFYEDYPYQIRKPILELMVKHRTENN